MSVRRRYDSDKQAAALLASALRDLPEKWVICRDVRHAWAVLNDFHVVGDASDIQRELVCMRCETVRFEIYLRQRNGSLEKVSQSYAYPEGYQIPGVPRGVKPSSIVQQEQYRRAMIKAAGAAVSDRETAER